MNDDTRDQPDTAKPTGWMSRNILGMGLASLFSDWNHEMATTVLPLLFFPCWAHPRSGWA